MKVSHIVAIDNKNGIGKDNQLLWHLPNDLKFFKSTTLNHHILMGRKNFDSIGRVLPKRTSFVISRNKDYTIDGAFTFTDITSAINQAKENGEKELFIIGGGEIYKQTFTIVDKIYLTKVNVELEADTFYPEINNNDWTIISETKHNKDEKHKYDFSILELEPRT